MKRILIGYINKGRTGGIDKYLLNFANKIKNKNIQIDFVTKCYDKDFHESLKAKGFNIYSISHNKHFIKQYKEMKNIFKNQYDIAYFNISETYNCVGLIAAKKANVKKIIVHSHSSSSSGKNKLIRTLKKCLNSLFKPVVKRCANTYLACSDLAAKWLYTKKIVKNEQYDIIYNSIDFNKFKYNEEARKNIRNKYNIADKFVIGFIGRFGYEKNTLFLIDILNEILKEKENAVLLCIGEGPYMDSFKTYAKEKNVLDKIIIAGVVDNSWDYYQSFDVFVLPSLYEGLPIVGVEAQISGCPSIFSDHITKHIIIGKNSYRESIKDASIWCKRICSIKERNNELLEVASNYDLNNSKQFDKIIN